MEEEILKNTSDQTIEETIQIKKTELEALTKEKDEYLDGWKRAKAEFINYKNEESNRLKEFSRMNSYDFIGGLIPVLDSFDLSLASLSKTADPELLKGVQMIKAQLENVLKKRGLEKIDSVKGDEVDPTLHEAIASVPSDLPENTVIDEIERGYMLDGKLIRPARVVVSKGKEN